MAAGDFDPQTCTLRPGRMGIELVPGTNRVAMVYAPYEVVLPSGESVPRPNFTFSPTPEIQEAVIAAATEVIAHQMANDGLTTMWAPPSTPPAPLVGINDVNHPSDSASAADEAVLVEDQASESSEISEGEAVG